MKFNEPIDMIFNVGNKVYCTVKDDRTGEIAICVVTHGRQVGEGDIPLSIIMAAKAWAANELYHNMPVGEYLNKMFGEQ